MADSAIATAADYADAMLVARRAKNVLVLILLLALLLQLALFFVARYTDVFARSTAGTTDPVTAVERAVEGAPAVTQPSDVPAAASAAVQSAAKRTNWGDVLHYVLGVSIFIGIAFSVMLSMVLMLIVTIMLVGRLIGVSRLTSAYVWCIFLIILLFPWQALLQDEAFTSRDFIVPGVLYTWDELQRFARFATDDMAVAVLKWARFVGFPVVAILILLSIQVKSNRGLKQALGEDDLSALTNTPVV
jgi:hypothetical protein